MNIRSAVCFLLTLSGCYRDKGNYDYIHLPDIKIEAEDVVYATQFDTLKLPVTVNWDNAYEGEYEFDWRIWSNEVGGNRHRKNIASTKDLTYVVKEIPGSYSLVLTCRNKRTEVNTYKHMTLAVQGSITEGWLVLREKDGETDFDLIMTPFISQRTEKDKILYGLYESVNGEKLAGKGIKIKNYFALGRYQYVTVLTDRGGVRLSAVTMQKTFDIATLMLDRKPLKPENYFFFDYYWCLGRGNEILISDGRYYINALLGDGFTEPILTNGETYKASPYGPRRLWTFAGMIYDEAKGRFLGIDRNMVAHRLSEADGRLFDWNNMHGSLLYMEVGFKNYDYALIEDWNTRKKTLYVLNFDKKKDFDVAMYPADNCPELDKAVCYAAGMRGNVFFYATEKNIYLYDYAGTNTGKKVYTLASESEKITGMKILKPCVDRFIKSHPYDNKVLVFSTYDEIKKEGKVYMYYFNESNGALDISSEKVFGGFGKISDMEYNFAKYGS